jgi:hypothetical protein
MRRGAIISAALEALEAMEVNPPNHPVRASGSSIFVGRERERAELSSGLSDALGVHGRLFLIAGEAGVRVERHRPFESAAHLIFTC